MFVDGNLIVVEEYYDQMLTFVCMTYLDAFTMNRHAIKTCMCLVCVCVCVEMLACAPKTCMCARV